jgi:filamentous hemagglutinin
LVVGKVADKAIQETVGDDIAKIAETVNKKSAEYLYDHRDGAYDEEDNSYIENYGDTELSATALGLKLLGAATGISVLSKGGKSKRSSSDGDNEVKGGPHKETTKPVNDGLDSHHCPAKDCYKGNLLSSKDGPAIKIDPADHRKTASYGSSPEAKAYRQKQKELVDQGKFKEAQQMDVDDIRSKFGNKYDDAIKQMTEYTETIDTGSLKK